MYSMTGYGKAEYKENGLDLKIEIKTVNNRNLDVTVKLPRVLIALEDAVRNVIKNNMGRGRVDVFVNFSDKNDKGITLNVNTSLATAYYKASCEIAETLGIANDYSVTKLMTAPDVVIADENTCDYAELKPLIEEITLKAVTALNEMRTVEGAKLVEDITLRMQTITDIVAQIKERAPLVAKEYKVKLEERIKTALSEVNYDEARLLNEVAFFTDKSNIDEELTRLTSHIGQFYEIIKQDGAGKKLDFLIQEFNREANTICSKSNDIMVTNYGLSLKNEIEKIREQIQNLE